MRRAIESDDHSADRQRYLKTYLQDHRAGAEAGVRLARRCRDHAPNEMTANELSRLVEEIEADRAALARMMDDLGVEPSALKNVASVAAERIGRLKLNGRVVRPSPLSVVMELEALVGAVSIKRQLWATMSARPGERSDDGSAALLARADDQRSRLLAIHDGIVRQVFGPAPAASDVAFGGPPDGSPG